MKKIYKLTLAMFVVLGTFTLAQAQKIDVGVHVVPSLPMGDFGNQYDFGIGGQLFGDYYLNENIHVGIEAGYLMYSADFMGEGVNMNIIPAQITGAYHLDAEDELDIFFGTGVGVFMAQQSFDDSDLDELAGTDMEALIGFSPRVGVSYELSRELRLHGYISYSYVIGNQETVTETQTQTTFIPGFGTVTNEVEVTTTTGLPDLNMLNANLGISYTIWD